MFREKPENKWVGPYTVVGVMDKISFIALNGTNNLMSIDEVKCTTPPHQSYPFCTPEPRNASVSGPAEFHMEPTAAPQSDVQDDLESILTRIRANPRTPSWQPRPLKVTSLSIELTAPIHIASNADVLMTQIIEQGHERTKSHEFAKAMRKRFSVLGKGTIGRLYRRTLFPLIFLEGDLCWHLRRQALVLSLQKPVM